MRDESHADADTRTVRRGPLERLGLRLRIFLFFALIGIGGCAAVDAALWFGYTRIDDPEALDGFVMAAILSNFAILALTAWIWLLFDENVAKPIEKLAGGLRSRAHAGVEDGIDHRPARYLGDLGPAARAVTENLSETKTALDRAVARQTAYLEEERARLAALLGDVPSCVLMCASDHRVVFYNGAARLLMDAEEMPGLGRPIFDMLRAAPIRTAYAHLTADPDRDVTTGLLCFTRQGGQTLQGRMRLVAPSAGGEQPCYVLTLRDVSGELSVHAEREAILEMVAAEVRVPARALLGRLREGALADGDEELAQLLESIEDLGRAYDTARSDWWPMTDVRARDLVDGIGGWLSARDIAISTSAEPTTLRCNPVEITLLVMHLAQNLARTHAAGALSLLAEPDRDEDGTGRIVLGWTGEPLPDAVLDRWLDDALDVGVAGVTGRRILAAHGSALRPAAPRAGRNAVQITLSVSDRPTPVSPRLANYDFALMSPRPVRADRDTPLADLTFVVFDTETTGLLPDEGDEIVQIAGIRMLGPRIVPGEVIDCLVDPERPIPRSATEVHGISDDMVAGAPTIATVGRRFHRFAADAVLVAHNAPFDMAFLRRHAPRIGRAFDHPVLDTVLLSAELFGQSETHTLDALAERLSVRIPPELRHTAMGDARATAEVLSSLIPMLQAKGMTTLGEAIDACQQHQRLLQDLNPAAG